ncbi:beta-ketoacyl-ACP synthase [Hoyosella rhizosphaerae]|uniref:3-oxoacyl-[acyl-carrier-protein] synthase 1 KasA n=1 Tax=Hoyosella rhizosphaerae TaxID=1755582 RepID=A0A916XHX6_9ACTN|nr:KasA/KasB family beta-ketoacyl-ACP synthase [Hoyosella rhizosphaerae]MBN4928013.1 beta-ketoacyl-ACP synthase [Hoyosella rhizosphaerae]GGC71709.1 3-oxoacyl-[acyl-carrier-protein] synthase 1 KasA [Hoyosella rhizosphaerae]
MSHSATPSPSAGPASSGSGYPSVVVTGFAANTSLAGDIDSTWKGLLAGESGIEALTDPWIEEYGIPVRIGGRLKVQPSESLTKVQIRRMDFVEQLALVEGRKAWAHAGSPEVDKDRLAVVIGTGIGGVDTLVQSNLALRSGGARKVSPMAVPMMMPNGPAATVGLELSAQAGVHTPVSACASGSEAIAQAWRMIALGDADVVVTGGVESFIDPMAIAGFSMMRAMSTRNDDPKGASRPFDRDRDGFVFGEAGAVLVLEREDYARARGATIHARVLGAGTTSDGYHIVAPEPDGTGAARAMVKAMRVAGVSPSEVAHINAHATATSVGDIAEARAINSAVGSHPAVYAAKSALGHSIGAVGALESILTVLSLREGVIPPTLNLENQDPEVNIDVVAGEPRHGQFDIAIKNSFGFGGHNVSIVFARA